MGDLRELEIHTDGSIAMEFIDSQISDAADRAERFAPGAPSDAILIIGAMIVIAGVTTLVLQRLLYRAGGSST